MQEAPENPEYDPFGHSVAYCETRNGRTIRRRWVPWAQLLLEAFALEIMLCPKCEGRMQRIAVIQKPNVIAAILEFLRQKDQSR